MRKAIYIVFLTISILIFGCASSIEATEFYEIGMAYFELGKFEEAEKWLNRARSSDRTMTASQYNLGRIAFEQQRFEEAAGHFESILKKDPNNILALRAAAYTRIKSGDINKAEKHYAKLLELVSESSDDGHNHALVLFAMGRYTQAEEVLEKYPLALMDNNEVILLYARCQAANNKPQAIDTYSTWLNNNTDAKVRFEYAALLEKNELYARALEEYKKALTEIPAAGSNLNKSEFIFAVARVLLIADGTSSEGITELQNAVKEGFNNISALEELANNRRISAANRDSIRLIINELRLKADS
ncbi:MAG: tetratricopeptide repeat protein [Treponema sp.]|jgi:tetratricopeptide (TPR) repeat protein|nr:tetratricopeptide repeat protein [Treponema sp.]